MGPNQMNGTRADKFCIGRVISTIALGCLLVAGLAALSACSSEKAGNTSVAVDEQVDTSAASEPTGSTNDSIDEGAEESESTPIDKSELEALIQQCEGLDSASYTKSSFREFKNALNEAEKVLKDDSKTQNQVDSAVVNLQHAIESLVEKFDPNNYETVSYEKIARNPDKYTGTKLRFTGNVLQVIEGEEENMIRLGTKDDYDDVVIVGYSPDLMSERILEDDQVTVYGDCIGLYSYESTFGETITLPAMVAVNIKINN